MALLQQEITDAVKVPVFLSCLLQVPLVSHLLRRAQYVVANSDALTAAHLKGVGIADEPL